MKTTTKKNILDGFFSISFILIHLIIPFFAFAFLYKVVCEMKEENLLKYGNTELVSEIISSDLYDLRNGNGGYQLQNILENKEEGVKYYVNKSSNSDFNSSALIIFSNENEIINNNTYNTFCDEMKKERNFNLSFRRLSFKDLGIDSYSCGIATKEVVESFNLISNQKVSIKEADRAIKISFKKIETDLEKAKREEAERASK